MKKAKNTALAGDTKKIKVFMRGLTEFEFHYLKQTVNVVSTIRNIIKKFGITPKEFCLAINIPLSRYKDYTSGNYEYTLLDISKVEVLWQEKEKELVGKNEIISVPSPKKLNFNKPKR